MESRDIGARRRRARRALAASFVVLAALGLGFFQLQVAGAPVRTTAGTDHRVYPIPVAAPRGMIVDRHGAIMADDATTYAVALLPASQATARGTLEALAPQLGFGPDHVEALLQLGARDGRGSLLVAEDVPFELADRIDRERDRYPGAWVETRPRRYYPAGGEAGHLLVALEAGLDARLRGRDGLRFLEVEPSGRVVGDHEPSRAVRPVSGQTVQLTVDLALQREFRALIPEAIRGGAVVLDAGTAEVLALFTTPGTDPSAPDPAGGGWPDRAMGLAYPPGRAWQAVTAAMGLGLGSMAPDATMPLPCRGGMSYGDRYHRCWDRRGHGVLDVAGALGSACDIFFFQLGLKIGLERMIREGSRAGFASSVGIDLPGEATPTFPPLQWPGVAADTASGEPTYEFANGLAPLEVTALRMAYHLATITMGRSPLVPAVLLDAPRRAPSSTPVLTEPARAALLDGLRSAVRPGGAAEGADLTGWDWGGVVSRPGGRGRGPDWFVGFAGPEGGPPAIVLAVVLENPDATVSAVGIAAHAARHVLGRRTGASY